MTLNAIAKESHKDAVKRQRNGANIDTSTSSMLKHTATEVVGATTAYVCWVEDICTYKEDASKVIFAAALAKIICCVAIIAESNSIDLDKAVMDCLKKNQARTEGKGDKK